MTQPLDNSDREFVEHWRRVGPMLEKVRARELREFNYADRRTEIDALLEIAAEHAVPRTTSGLVEMQQIFAQRRTTR